MGGKGLIGKFTSGGACLQQKRLNLVGNDHLMINVNASVLYGYMF